MVVFTCQHCGDSVTKPKVQKHYDTRCKYRPPHLTCVDCLKDFNDQEYNSHTQCVSEAERYSAKGTVIKEHKGRKKQAVYTEMIQKLLNSKNVTYVQRQLLDVCSAHENVPRKLKKFHNFMTNVARHVHHTKSDEAAVFQLIENAWLAEQNLLATENSDNNTKNESKVMGKSNSTSTVKQEGNVENECSEGDSTKNKSPESNKTKKNKHQNDTLTTGEEKMQVDENYPPEEVKDNINGLSKKQLKKQKKNEKYLMELKNEVKNKSNYEEEIGCDRFEKTKKKSKKSKIQTISVEDQENINNLEIVKKMEVDGKRKQKKSKNRNDLVNGQADMANKGAQSTAISGKADQEGSEEGLAKSKKKSKKFKMQQAEMKLVGSEESENKIEMHPVETVPKKGKKRKLDDGSLEITDKKMKTGTNEEEDGNEIQKTFDWTDVILKVLGNREDKELSIKRLGKKVIDEYQTLRPDDHRTYEELLAKFNKKVKKTKGVKVLKDKAKLVV